MIKTPIGVEVESSDETSKPKPFWEQVMDTVPARFGAAMERASHGAEPAKGADAPIPREPTEAMMQAAYDSANGFDWDVPPEEYDKWPIYFWRAMYDAARASPIKAEVTTGEADLLRREYTCGCNVPPFCAIHGNGRSQ